MYFQEEQEEPNELPTGTAVCRRKQLIKQVQIKESHRIPKKNKTNSSEIWETCFGNSTDVDNPTFFEKQKLSQKKTTKFLCVCVSMYLSESNKQKSSINKLTQTKESQSIPKKSKTIEVMKFCKRNFDKLKPTALSQKQTVFAANNQRCMQKKDNCVPDDTKVFPQTKK